MYLYDLADQYNDLLDLLDIDASDEELQEMLEGLQEKIEDKIDAVLSVRNAKRAESKALRDEIARLTERSIKTDNDANRLEILVESTMNKLGIEKLKTFKFTTWMQMSPPSVVITNESMLPDMYFVEQPRKIDRRRLLDDIKNGIYNCQPDVATIYQNKYLRVK